MTVLDRAIDHPQMMVADTEVDVVASEEVGAVVVVVDAAVVVVEEKLEGRP